MNWRFLMVAGASCVAGALAAAGVEKGVATQREGRLAAIAPAKADAYVTTLSAQLRARPHTGAQARAVLPIGEPVNLIARKGDWVLAAPTTTPELTGFLPLKHVAGAKPDPTALAARAKAAHRAGSLRKAAILRMRAAELRPFASKYVSDVADDLRALGDHKRAVRYERLAQGRQPRAIAYCPFEAEQAGPAMLGVYDAAYPMRPNRAAADDALFGIDYARRRPAFNPASLQTLPWVEAAPDAPKGSWAGAAWTRAPKRACRTGGLVRSNEPFALLAPEPLSKAQAVRALKSEPMFAPLLAHVIHVEAGRIPGPRPLITVDADIDRTTACASCVDAPERLRIYLIIDEGSGRIVHRIGMIDEKGQAAGSVRYARNVSWGRWGRAGEAFVIIEQVDTAPHGQGRWVDWFVFDEAGPVSGGSTELARAPKQNPTRTSTRRQ